MQRLRDLTAKGILRATLALTITVGFLSTLAALMFAPYPVEAQQVLLIMVGVLGTLTTQVFGFYFGSSQGSADKAAQMAELARSPQGDTP